MFSVSFDGLGKHALYWKASEYMGNNPILLLAYLHCDQGHHTTDQREYNTKH